MRRTWDHLPGNPHQEPEWRLLVVDDEDAHRALLLEIFDDAGVMIQEASSGAQALAILEKQCFDLMLLDNNMPGMTGLELCGRLRQDPCFDHMPIILVTALCDPVTLSRGLAAGANDFVGKPYSPLELEARVRSHLVRARLQRDLKRLHDQLRAEREMVERLIVRMRVASHHDNRGMDWIMTSVEQTTGDLVLSAMAPDGSQLVMVADFTGHGLPAAMASPLLTYIFSTQVREGRGLLGILNELNRELCLRTPPDLYLAVLAVELDPARQHLTVFNGGMPDALLTGTVEPWQSIPSRNLPLGILDVADNDLTTENFALAGHEVLYLYSDGVLEQSSPSGERFGSERIRQGLLKAPQGMTALQHLLRDLTAFAGTDRFDDDVTMVSLIPG